MIQLCQLRAKKVLPICKWNVENSNKISDLNFKKFRYHWLRNKNMVMEKVML